MAIIDGKIYPERIDWGAGFFYLKDNAVWFRIHNKKGNIYGHDISGMLPGNRFTDEFNVAAERALFNTTLKHILAGDI